MITNDLKFIFIHIPKTAGTSIRKLLEPLVKYKKVYFIQKMNFIFGIQHCKIEENN